MRFKSVKHNLGILISDGHKWQNIDVNGIEMKPKFYFSGIQYTFLAISIISLFLIKKGFGNDFIGYIIASLSIFVGLFLTLILSVFDKFEKVDFDKKHISEKERNYLIKKKNFFKQFTALTTYSILISITSILLLSISLLSTEFQVDIFNYSFVNDLKEINWKTFFYFLYILFISLYRISIVYLFLDFLLMVVYALSSIYNYIALEYDKKKIN